MAGIRTAARLLQSGALGRLVVAIYTVATLLSPLSHHDLACHLKSATHCTTCVVGSSAEPHSPGALHLGDGLAYAGTVSERPVASPEVRSLDSIPPRAPPTAPSLSA
jgi:hypothetical protein